ncbi:MAG: glycosyltransferase [Thermoleophilaceae bacterium]
MKILMSSTAGAGHVGPLVPFAEACVQAGHEVRIAVPDKALPIVEGAGLAGLPVGYPSEEEMGPIWERVERASPQQKEEIVIHELFGRLYTRAALPGMLTAVETWRPDLIVGESGELSSSLAAELHGVPQARVAVTLGLEDEFHALLGGALDDLRQELGLPQDSALEALGRLPELSLAPPSFNAGGPSTHRFRTSKQPTPPLPDWWPGDGRPLAYVTFGTAIPQMDFFPELFRAAVDALENVPARVLFTVGVHRTPAELGPVPANVHVEQWVDQQAVLPHTDVVACHGGSGTTLGALAQGIPLAVLPVFADQPQNADRVDALGAGIAVHGGPVAAPRLGRALSTLLGDPSYRAAAGELAGEVNALPPIDEAVGVLEKIAGYVPRARAAA